MELVLCFVSIILIRCSQLTIDTWSWFSSSFTLDRPAERIPSRAASNVAGDGLLARLLNWTPVGRLPSNGTSSSTRAGVVISIPNGQSAWTVPLWNNVADDFSGSINRHLPHD